MNRREESPAVTGAFRRRFQIGPPEDREGVVHLFSLLLEQADEQSALGKRFGLPFAALVKLANTHRPTLEELNRFCESRHAQDGWPDTFEIAAKPPGDDAAPAMFFTLLRAAVDSAQVLDIDGARVCRALAAVGQTLDARSRRLRHANRMTAGKYRASSRQRSAAAPSPPAAPPAAVQLAFEPPSEVDFRSTGGQGGCLRSNGIVLWHASYIGPRIATKSENQDATFAILGDEASAMPHLIFALADGVTTSMGSRVAANAIVRRFCEIALQQIPPGAPVQATDLVEAAKRTQATLDDMAASLLEHPQGYVFDAVRGSELQSRTATLILENTLHPRSSAIPAALTATLIAGIAQSSAEGTFTIDLLRIGDGVVEHVEAGGQVSAVLETNPEVVAISQALGSGPRSRALFDNAGRSLETRTVTLQPGESLLISSDGLVRGHQQTVTAKLSELTGAAFWQTAQPTQPDAALAILHQACRAADELSETDPEQVLFADNVSLILIRCDG
jgi:serine/threonine protein phosphatase PrpC